MGGSSSKEKPKPVPNLPRPKDSRNTEPDKDGASATTKRQQTTRRKVFDPDSFPTNKTVVELKSPKNNALMVVGIDFGTTFSGYGYSFKAKPDEFFTNYWDGANLKTPTQVLFSPDKKFHSFGLEAMKEYEKLIKAKDDHRWYYFSRFKMKLFVKDGPLDIDMKLTDIRDKEMLAIDVFAAAIEFMVQHCKEVLNQRPESVKIRMDRDIHWVLTVPAIWDDLSKKFMRNAATKAGIPDDMLSIALEPEAASLFCKKNFRELNLQHGTRYMVMDLGGGTADITCHEVNEDGTLKELHKATGGDFGGTSLDDKFMDTLSRLHSAKVIKDFKQKHMNDYWELLKEFERKKKSFDGSERIVFQFPVELLTMHEKSTDEEVMATLRSSPLNGKLEFKQGKIFIEKDFAKEMFDCTVDKIRKAAQEIVDKVDHIEHIILVGGFSESPYLQRVMKEHFANLIRIPNEPAGAVLKGAVVFGHEIKAISSRVCKFTYGIARMMKFKPDQHPEEKRIRHGRMDYCDDLFNKHIEIGQQVSLESSSRAAVHEYYPSVEYMKQAVLEVYASPRRNPTFTDEPDCTLVGLIKVDIDPNGDIWAKLNVKLIFGGTELIVEVHDVSNNTTTRGTVDFFG